MTTEFMRVFLEEMLILFSKFFFSGICGICVDKFIGTDLEVSFGVSLASFLLTDPLKRF